jgi:hypothetical protein
MPKVGSRHYSYTPAGRAAAKKASVRTGKAVTNKKQMAPSKKRPR